jgi:uncharacterized protein (TIGR03000 family)
MKRTSLSVLAAAALAVCAPGSADACGRWGGWCRGGWRGGNCGGWYRGGCWSGYSWGRPCYSYYGGPAYYLGYNYPSFPSYADGVLAGPADVSGGPTTAQTGLTAAGANTATVEVRLPKENAGVWFDNDRMGQTGLKRVFRSEAFDPNREYTYDVTARWTEGDQQVERRRTVTIRAGQRSVVDFTSPNP